MEILNLKKKTTTIENICAFVAHLCCITHLWHGRFVMWQQHQLVQHCYVLHCTGWWSMQLVGCILLFFFHWTRFLDLLQQACYCCCYCCWYYLCCRNLFIAACLPIECGTAAMRALLLLLFLSFFCFCVCCTVFRFVVVGSVLLFALFPHNSIIYAWILSATLDFSTSSSNVQLSI